VQLAGWRPELPARTVELRSPSTGEVVRPAPGSGETDPLRRAGLWQAMDERGAVRSIIAVNADPAGSRTDPQPERAIRDWLAAGVPGAEVRWLDGLEQEPGAAAGAATSLHAIFDRRADDARLALPLLIAALLIALFEVAMGRWFSHASRPASPAAATVVRA
jgi:hypothetical protein